MPAPFFPHGIDRGIIHWCTENQDELPDLLDFNIAHLEERLDKCNIPLLEFLSIYNVDKVTYAADAAWEAPLPDLDWQDVWDFQHQKALSWLYAMEAQELTQTYTSLQIKASQDIIRQNDLVDILRKQAILRLKLVQLKLARSVL